MMNLRPRTPDAGNNDPWYSPERDILNLTPSLVTRGAAYAASPESSLFQWLAEGIAEDSVRVRVRRQLTKILEALYASRKSKLIDESFDISKAEWPVFQAIMCGVGVTLTQAYSKCLQSSRMTNVDSGLIIEPVQTPDLDRYLSAFDRMTKG